MASLSSFLNQAENIRKKKTYTVFEDNKKTNKKKFVKMSSSTIVSDFGVPFLQRLAIEAKEGIKTIKGVAKDVITKKVYTDPKINKQWTSSLGDGFNEARNRVKQSLRKANDKNIMSELEKNKGLDLQVDRMRQAAKKKYTAGALRDLAPLSRMENDGLLSIDKRFNVGKQAKK